MHFFSVRTRGLTMVEVLIASAIILTAVVVLLGVHSLYLKTALENGQTVQAAYLAEEGVEVMRYLRDASWSQNIAPLSLNTPYGLALSGAWITNATSTWIGAFYRIVTLSAVERDAASDIVASGGTLDPNTKLLTVSVSWPQRGATTTKTVATYLTNLHGN
jgi:Tfp pilus assembly protein PilV